MQLPNKKISWKLTQHNVPENDKSVWIHTILYELLKYLFTFPIMMSDMLGIDLI